MNDSQLLAREKLWEWQKTGRTPSNACWPAGPHPLCIFTISFQPHSTPRIQPDPLCRWAESIYNTWSMLSAHTPLPQQLVQSNEIPHLRQADRWIGNQEHQISNVVLILSCIWLIWKLQQARDVLPSWMGYSACNLVGAILRALGLTRDRGVCASVKISLAWHRGRHVPSITAICHYHANKMTERPSRNTIRNYCPQQELLYLF